MPKKYRPLLWLAVAVLAPPALALLAMGWMVTSGWNWLREPLQDLVLQKTGRELRIDGDLDVVLGWPTPRVRAQAVRFANPSWAAAPQMVTADAVEVSVEMPALLRGRLVFSEVRLTDARVFLEQTGGGRKTWLLDRAQSDEAMRIPVGRLRFDRGEASCADASQRTAVHAVVSTRDATAAGGVDGLVFEARGLFRGQPLVASGHGGDVVSWRDTTRPYLLRVDATVGRTRAQIEGSVTGLHEWAAVDLQLALAGDSLAELFPLVGMALPPTPAYRSAGRLVRSGGLWRYEKFTGRIGRSDVAGTLQLDTGGARALLSGAVDSRRLDLADLGPAIGARKAVAAGTRVPARRVLPDLPIDTTRWAGLDADVTLRAQALLHADALPLDNLQVRVLLRDSRMTLDPLSFDVAGGRMTARVMLDGRADPVRAQVSGQLRGLKLGLLVPRVGLSKAGVGQLDGNVELAGRGASVARMLAGADGRLSLVARNGEISRLLMEQSGLHLLEILHLQLTGDQSVRMHCAVADFGVVRGVMQVRALVLDTDVNTLIGSGHIDLAQETVDLGFVPHTKISSMVALRTPFHVRGSLSRPLVVVDSGRIAARGAGALALGLLNPLLALIPLFDAGPGVDSDCARLVREAHAPIPKVRH